MMKRIIILPMLFFAVTDMLGQSLFFDHLGNSSWASTPGWTDSTIRKSKQIGLGKLVSKDSLKEDVTIWDFKDSGLVITYYDVKLRKSTVVANYKYRTDDTTLKIIFNDSEVSSYSVGITSAGNNALLIKKKIKKRKEIKRF